MKKAAAKIAERMIMAWMLLLLPLLSGCVAQELGNCQLDRVLYIKVATQEGEDITAEGRVTHADMFVFGNGGFIRRIEITGEQIIDRVPITVEGNSRVVVWGNVDYTEEISEITTPENSKITMHVNSEGYVSETSDLFFGLENLAMNASIEEITIYPKAARLHVTVRGVEEGTSSADYSLRIEQKNNGYTFMGNPTQNPTIMPAGLEWNSVNYLVTPTPINIISTIPDADDGLVVKLLDKNGNLIARAERDQEGELITPRSGQMANVLIDMTISGLEISIRITEWDEIFQWVDF